MKDKNAIIKWVIFAALVVTSLYFVTTLPIRRGLDLAGGTSFTVQVDEDQLRSEIKERLESPDSKISATPENIDAEFKRTMGEAIPRAVEVIRNRIDGMGVNEPTITPVPDKNRINIEIPGADAEQRAEAERNLSNVARLSFRLVHTKSVKYVDDLFSNGVAPKGYEITTGDARNSRVLARTADYKALSTNSTYAAELKSFRAPANTELMLEPIDLSDGRRVYAPYYVQKKVEMGGEGITGAEIEQDPTSGGLQVSLSFNAKAQAEFAKVTGNYCPDGRLNKNNQVGRQLAIVLDDTLYSAPVINSRIDGNAVITGRFNRKEAAQLRNVLKAGSLPVPVKIIESHVIDPTLGAQAINSGMLASLIGGGLVIVFMLVYYFYFGLVADLALVLNIILLPLSMLVVSGIFSVFGAVETTNAGIQLPVLTMPGIAGIVLTIGMAVDANVLIFERIREEFKQGKSPRAAIAAGYDRAFLAIFDSNITTFLTAVILFVFGSGPIRGFAITLSAGILVSMYTALMVTRMVFSLTVPEIRVKPYKMSDWFKFPKIDFIALGKKLALLSCALIVLTLGIFAINCARNPLKVMSIDFTGGSLLKYNVTGIEMTSDRADIEQTLKSARIDDASVQSYQSDGKKILEVKSGYDMIGGESIAEAATKALSAKYNAKFVIDSNDQISSVVGDDLKVDAVKAVIIALIGMIIYISIRFEFGFALGAIAALTHDVLITLGLYTLFGSQVGITAIACLLTIVGYSVNDTIVIFDRIRENMRLDVRKPFLDLVNDAINQTLGRTALTSVTTLLATLALFVFGGGAIFDFALAMLIGILAGTFSSLFVAPLVMTLWYRGRRPASFAEKK